MFPIENAEKRLFFRSSLKHKDEGEVNMYSCGVRLGELIGWPVRALVLSPDISGESEGASLEDAQEAISHTCSLNTTYAATE